MKGLCRGSLSPDLYRCYFSVKPICFFSLNCCKTFRLLFLIIWFLCVGPNCIQNFENIEYLRTNVLGITEMSQIVMHFPTGKLSSLKSSTSNLNLFRTFSRKFDLKRRMWGVRDAPLVERKELVLREDHMLKNVNQENVVKNVQGIKIIVICFIS